VVVAAHSSRGGFRLAALNELQSFLTETHPGVKVDDLKPGTKPGYLLNVNTPQIIYIGGVRDGYDGEFAFWEACIKELDDKYDKENSLSDSETKILTLIRIKPRTVREISNNTNYTINTVRISIKYLIDENLVFRGDKVENHSGRGHPSYLFYGVGVKYPSTIRIKK
jgi:hypothetical protein